MTARKLILLGCACALASTSVLAAEAAEEAPGTILELVVTGQRRAEVLKEVPVSMTVQTGAALDAAGITNSRDIMLVVPGLHISQFGAQTIPTMRGIASLGSSIGNDPSIALYVDGVYQPSQSVNTFDLPDMERIEVLKGPQGTLYGRNATGGVIHITTRDPTFTPTGSLTASYGSFDQKIAKGYVGGPLVGDVLAGSISGLYLKQDGYNHDLLRGGYLGRKDTKSLRVKLLFKPAEQAKFLLTYWYVKSYDESGQTGNAIAGNSIGNAAGALTPSKPWDVALDVIPFVALDQRGASLRADFDLGFAGLTSLTAINRNRVSNIVPSDYSALPNFNYVGNKPDNMFQQDVQLVSQDSEKLEWIVGASYYTNKAYYTPFIVLTPGSTTPNNNWLQLDAKAWAAFGEVTYTSPTACGSPAACAIPRSVRSSTARPA